MLFFFLSLVSKICFIPPINQHLFIFKSLLLLYLNIIPNFKYNSLYIEIKVTTYNQMSWICLKVINEKSFPFIDDKFLRQLSTFLHKNIFQNRCIIDQQFLIQINDFDLIQTLFRGANFQFFPHLCWKSKLFEEVNWKETRYFQAS